MADSISDVLWQQAEAGEPNALVELTQLLLNADLTQEAVDFLTRRGEAGNSKGMCLLAGLVRESQPEVALAWYKEAAQAGSVEGMYGAGYMLHKANPQDAIPITRWSWNRRKIPS